MVIKFFGSEEGEGITEYMFLVSLIVIVAISLMLIFRDRLLLVLWQSLTRSIKKIV